MKIYGIEGLTRQEIESEVQHGGKFVFYLYCISIVIMTFKRSSDVYFIKAGEDAKSKGLRFTLISLIAGWWGIPWGPIYTLQAIFTNAGGGQDVTTEVLSTLNPEVISRGELPRPAPAPSKSNTRARLIFAGLLALLIVPCCGLLIFRIYQGQQLVSKWQGFEVSCEGKPLAAASSYKPGPGLHPIVYFFKINRWHLETQGYFETTPSWLPENPRNVELVACFKEESEKIETCEYNMTKSNAVKRVVRISSNVNVTLREASTGEIVAEKTFAGKTPQACSDEENFRDSESEKTFTEERVDKKEMETWLKEYVQP